MSVRQYDEEPFPYQVEHYDGLERGQWIEVRQNDVKLPVGSRGVVLKKVAETGNYQVAVEVEGEAQKRIVALCPDQVRPVDPPLPEEPEPAEPPKARQAGGWTAEKRAEQAERVKAMWARKKAEREAAAAAEPQPEKVRHKLTQRPAPEPIAAAPLMTRHRPEGMDEAIAAAVHGEPEPELVTAIRHVQGYRERPSSQVEPGLLEAIRQLRPEPAAQLAPVTWTRRAADAIRPVLAEAATGGADPVQLALLVETISYLEDGGRP